MMTQIRTPSENELPDLYDFLTQRLRENSQWTIDAEYPTALTSQNIHNMRIITDDHKNVLSHAVVKPLIIKSPHIIFKVGAIGSVTTAPEHEGKGLSTQILKDCLDAAKAQQCDIALLWTNLYDFYRKLNFELSGSEISVVVEEEFQGPLNNLRFMNSTKVSPEAIYKLYATHTVNSVRTVEETRKFMQIPNTIVYTAWETDGQLAAFAIEGKGADLGGYIHEWGGSVSKLMSLFSYIRQEKQQPYTIIIPKHSQNLITQLRTKPVSINEGYLGMIKMVNEDQLFTKIKRAFRSEGVADIVLENQNGLYVFGCGKDFVTVQNEKEIVRLLFGPVNYEELEVFSEETVLKLNKVLPLKLWVWGWDSI